MPFVTISARFVQQTHQGVSNMIRAMSDILVTSKLHSGFDAYIKWLVLNSFPERVAMKAP